MSNPIQQLTHDMGAFNRFYTGHLGALNEHLLGSEFSLTEARVLYELATGEDWTAADLGETLHLDPAYLSRILARFQRLGLVARRPNPSDGRSRILELTQAGKTRFRDLDAASQQRVEAVLDEVSPDRRDGLAHAIVAIRAALDPVAQKGAVTIRPARMGDVSWAVHRQSALYRDEYRWHDRFEALVLEIGASFLRGQARAFGRCWVAERGGAILGSVFFVVGDDGEAVLRMLYVEPEARGLGVGRALVETCIGHARASGHRIMRLWTNDVLVAARCLYDSLGFVQVDEKPHADFGPSMKGQVLELAL